MGDVEMSPVNDSDKQGLTLTASGKVLEDPFENSTFQFLYSETATRKQRIFASIISALHIGSFIFVLQYAVSNSNVCTVKVVTPKSDKFEEILTALSKTPEFSNQPGAGELIMAGGDPFANFFPDDYHQMGGGYYDYGPMPGMMPGGYSGGYSGPGGDSMASSPMPTDGGMPGGDPTGGGMASMPPGVDPCMGLSGQDLEQCTSFMKQFGDIPTGFMPSEDGLSSGNPSCDDCVAGLKRNKFCTAAPNQLQPVLSLQPPLECSSFLIAMAKEEGGVSAADQIELCYKIFEKVCGAEQDAEKKAAAANGLFSTLVGSALLMVFLLPEMSKGVTLFRLQNCTIAMKIAGSVQVATGIIAMMVASLLITNEFAKCSPDGLVSAAAPVAVSFLNEVPQKAYQFYEETGQPIFYVVMMFLGLPLALMFTAMANPSILEYIFAKLSGDETFGATAPAANSTNSTNSSTTTTTTTDAASGGDTTSTAGGAGDNTGTTGGSTGTGTAGGTAGDATGGTGGMGP